MVKRRRIGQEIGLVYTLCMMRCIHTLSDETRFIINPMGSEYYNQGILRENWMGKLLSSSICIYVYMHIARYHSIWLIQIEANRYCSVVVLLQVRQTLSTG